MARWRAGEIVRGEVTPVEGADLIRHESAMPLGYPAELQPFVHKVAQWYASADRPHRSKAQVEAEIVQYARDFVAAAAADPDRPGAAGN
jgi:hypothetical protein